MADDRTYIKVHDSITEHPKIVLVSDERATWLLIAMWSYCSRFLTDGLVPKTVAHRLTAGASRARCQKLLKVGLLTEQGEFYACHDYLQHQMSAADRRAAKEQRRLAGVQSGRARAQRKGNESLNESLNGKSNGKANENPTDVDVDVRGTSKPHGGVVLVTTDPRDPTTATSDVVAAFINGARSAGFSLPGERTRSKVGRDALNLLREGTNPTLLAQVAFDLGQTKYDDLEKQLRIYEADRSGRGTTSGKQAESTNILRNDMARLRAKTLGELT